MIVKRKHYSEYYQERIAQLERELRVVGVAAREAERHGTECLTLLAQEKLRRQNAEKEIEHLRRQNAELNARAALWERDGKKLHLELGKMKQLSAAYAAAQQRLKELEKKLNIRKGTEDPYGINTPSSRKVSKANSTPENRAKRGGVRAGHRGHGRRDFSPAEADRVRINLIPPRQPCCDHPALQAVGTVNHAVYHFIPMTLELVMNVNTRFRCDNCGCDVFAPTPDAMPGAKFSNAAAAQMMAEAYFHQTPLGRVAERYGINKGTLIGMAHRYADLLQPLFKRLVEELREVAFLHADETGWSMDGKRAYAWLFANDDFRLFLFRDSRGSKVPGEVLGLQQLMLILITDRYRGYLPLLVERQLCFVHLLRDVEKLKLEFSDEPEVKTFCLDFIPLLQAAIKLRQTHPDRHRYLEQAEQIQTQIMTICHHSAHHPGIQHLQDIFRLNEKNLFQWVKNPDIPCENNFAERHLRPIVISRKLSFGCQSERGMHTREILMSVLHSAKCRGYDPTRFLEQILNSLTLDPDADIAGTLSNPPPRAATAAA